jgi:hypothetical protein
MKLLVKKGATSVLACIFIQDSSSTTGAGLSGLVFNTAGLICYRARADDGNAGGTAITLATATLGTWATGGFVEKDATHMKGVYEIGITNASLAAGSDYCILYFSGATNMAPLVLEIQLVAFDPDDAVHMGLSSLPNTACTTNASLLTSGTGTDQISVSSGNVKVTSNIKKNSSSRLTFTMTDSTNHNPKTGLTVAGQVSIDGAGFANLTNTPATEIASGDYTIALAAADTNGNTLLFRFTATAADDLNIMAITQP